MEKPRICEVLGVEVGEVFKIGEDDCYIDENGNFRSYGGFYFCSLVEAINNPDQIIKRSNRPRS